MRAKSLQSCLTLYDPIDCSLPGSSVHGILQARILEGAAIPLLQGIFPMQGSNPHVLPVPHWQAGSFTPSATWKGQYDKNNNPHSEHTGTRQ